MAPKVKISLALKRIARRARRANDRAQAAMVVSSLAKAEGVTDDQLFEATNIAVGAVAEELMVDPRFQLGVLQSLIEAKQLGRRV